jgi:hypothetical protein
MVMTGKRRKAHKWTEDELDYIRCNYRGTVRSKQEIARMLSYRCGEDITVHQVTGRIQAMGLAAKKAPPWTEKEIRYLERNANSLSLTKMARKLGRSVNAVKVKEKRMNLRRRYRDGWFTKKEVCEILGADHKKVQGWIDSGELAAEWNNPDIKPCGKGMSYWRIQQEDLREFIRRYAGELQGRNVDIFMIVEILAGIEAD